MHKSVSKKASVKIRLAMTLSITMPILADTVKHYSKIVNELSGGSGEGMNIWREVAGKYNLYQLLDGATSIQMAGWYKKEMLSIKDSEGLRIRMVWIAEQVLSKLGVATKSTSGSEIVPNLERSVLDVAEWVSPVFDLKLDIHKIAPYYCTPWQETGSITEFMFNKQKWESYPKEMQSILEVASREAHMQMTAMGQFYNAKAMDGSKSTRY